MHDTDIHEVMGVLKDLARDWDIPAIDRVTEHIPDPFRVLISCLLSLRTKDEVTDQASERLFRKAPTIERMVQLSPDDIQHVIYPVGFYRNKAQTIKRVSEIVIEKYRGKVPSTLNELLSLPGVGRKTANLVLTLGFGKLGICVDTHVHRITNRWGYLRTKNPEETECALRKKLPVRYWIEFNSLLVSFGQRVCRPISPFCSQCPLRGLCNHVGVVKSR